MPGAVTEPAPGRSQCIVCGRTIARTRKLVTTSFRGGPYSAFESVLVHGARRLGGNWLCRDCEKRSPSDWVA